MGCSTNARGSRIKVAASTLLCAGLICLSSAANASSFLFSGSDGGGTGSATMDIDIVGTVLTLNLDNTSPTSLNPPETGDNTPGIVGFGFDLDPDGLTLNSWELEAYDDQSQLMTIGDGDPTDDWVMGTFQAGVTREFLPNTDTGVQGAIYNPLATSGFAALPNYFSTARLVMNFDLIPTLDASSVYVRMQNVGKNGEGSLKLFGTPDEPSTGPVPEPASVSIFAFGAALMGGIGWRRQRKASRKRV